ncbi:unnamed protein product [marine sediment metagenome]|uniref:Nucleotidyltransferase n=1 Tax=marine sediment metagenome TaxID=412755 RepID=X0XHS5_9ZZZZ
MHIKENFDVDAYIICKEYNGISLPHELLNGEYFFTTLHDDLNHIHNNVNENLKIKAKLPRTHAILVELHYQNKILKIDCIPAIELPDDFLLVPDGWKHCKKINLKYEENGLKKLNKKHYGNGTKLILLIKFWNWRLGKPLKSYVIQRLVEEIFMHDEINDWKGAARIFFREAIQLFQKHYKNELILKDRVYTHRSILKDYKVKQINKFNTHLMQAYDLVKKNQWEQLFGK